MKPLFESITKRSHPKGIALAFNYYKPGIPKNDPSYPKHPIFFHKALSSLIHKPKEVKLDGLNPINFEVELGAVIGKRGKRIAKNEWEQYIGGYFLLIDFTLDPKGILDDSPDWFLRKSMDNFFVVGDFVEKEAVKDPHDINLLLTQNGKEMQKSNTNQLLHKLPEIIEYVSKFMTLNEGDLILTGTPPGMAPVSNNDRIIANFSTPEGKILDSLDFKINI